MGRTLWKYVCFAKLAAKYCFIVLFFSFFLLCLQCPLRDLKWSLSPHQFCSFFSWLTLVPHSHTPVLAATEAMILLPCFSFLQYQPSPENSICWLTAALQIWPNTLEDSSTSPTFCSPSTGGTARDAWEINLVLVFQWSYISISLGNVIYPRGREKQ